MTRDEKLEEEYARQGLMVDFDVCEFINEIYDDFESRTCESCKHYGGTKFSINKSCQTGISVHYYNLGHKDFGCNKFERKTNE